MPVYDYECQKCGVVIEMEHRADEEPPRKRCPECRGKLSKVFNPVGIVFKGSGFYATDSRKKSSKAIPAKTECASCDKSCDSKSESKTEAPACAAKAD